MKERRELSDTKMDNQRLDLVGNKRSLNLTIGTGDEHLQRNPKMAHLDTPLTSASTATNFSFGEGHHDSLNDLQNQVQQIELLKSKYNPQTEKKQETTAGAYSDIMIKSQITAKAYSDIMIKSQISSFETFINTYEYKKTPKEPAPRKKSSPPQSNHSKRKNAANAKRLYLSQVVADAFSHVNNSGLDS